MQEKGAGGVGVRCSRSPSEASYPASASMAGSRSGAASAGVGREREELRSPLCWRVASLLVFVTPSFKWLMHNAFFYFTGSILAEYLFCHLYFMYFSCEKETAGAF